MGKTSTKTIILGIMIAAVFILGILTIDLASANHPQNAGYRFTQFVEDLASHFPITSVDILDDTITSADIADGTITTTDLGDSGCADNEVLKWNVGTTSWECAVDIDTNAGTLCTAGQFLDGDGTCKNTLDNKLKTLEFRVNLLEDDQILPTIVLGIWELDPPLTASCIINRVPLVFTIGTISQVEITDGINSNVEWLVVFDVGILAGKLFDVDPTYGQTNTFNVIASDVFHDSVWNGKFISGIHSVSDIAITDVRMPVGGFTTASCDDFIQEDVIATHQP